jgi:dihydroxyacetone kinase-like predicted kinase
MVRRRAKVRRGPILHRGGVVIRESETLRRWLESGTKAVKRERARLDAINVFPVADSDTGTNLYLTLREGNRAVAYLPESASHREVVAAFARGCLMGARGNSGVIVSQYLTAFLAHIDTAGGLAKSTGETIAGALEDAADAAYDAVGEPVEGTILTVARAAAEGARGAVEAGAGLEAVAVAAIVSARSELARTTEVLAEAKAAGVVDAGAAGLLLQLEVLAETIVGPDALAAIDEVEWEMRERIGGLTPAAGAAAHENALGGGAYEVMFVARANRITDDTVDVSLKGALGEVGDSVAVTGIVGLWQAHVHTDYPEKAIELARAVSATQIVVRDVMRAGCDGPTGIVALTTCPGLASALAGAGAAVLVSLDPEAVAVWDLERILVDAGTDRVLVVAGAPALADAARALAESIKDPAVVVLDSLSEPQVVAALIAAALVSPGEEAEGAMQAAIARCTSARARLDSIVEDLSRMITPDTEDATIILGDGIPVSIAEEAVRLLAVSAPGVDVQIYSGGQAVPAVIVGVETAVPR